MLRDREDGRPGRIERLRPSAVGVGVRSRSSGELCSALPSFRFRLLDDDSSWLALSASGSGILTCLGKESEAHPRSRSCAVGGVKTRNEWRRLRKRLSECAEAVSSQAEALLSLSW